MLFFIWLLVLTELFAGSLRSGKRAAALMS
jgi:hypothetical protein